MSPRVPLPTPHSSLPTLKISDFGLARVLGSRSDLTATGQVIGTPSYMAPEQAAGTVDDVSPAQDIYSLGAILYELLTGRPPFRGSSLFDTLEQVRTTEAVPPRQLQPRVPRDLETICLKCLEKSPDRRYPTAAALAEDLQRVQDGNTITARPAGSFERSWKWVRRYPAIASLVLLTFLLTIVGAFGILREARRANLSERSAKLESQRAEQLHKLADRERDDAKLQRRLAEESQKKTEHSAEVALRERRIAEQQRLIADTERTRAQEAQTQAEASLEETMQAINSLAVLGASLRNQPGQQALSKRLYDDTLLMYENLAMRKGDNPAIRRQRIMALINAGDIHRTLRNTEQSEQLLLQAAQLIEEELKYDPNNAELNLLAHGPYWHLGVLYKDTGRTTESLEHFRKDVLALENVLKTKAGDLNNMTRLANSLTNECVALRQLGRNVEAAERYEKSIALLRAVLKALPSHLAASSELGMALQDYSLLLRSLRRFDDSKAAFQESFELRLKAYQQAPKASYTRTFLSRMYVSQGYFDRIEKKHESSLEQFQKAIDLLVPSVDEYPDLYEHQKDLLVAMAEHLVSCLETRNAEIGKPAWQRFSNRLQVTLQKFPKDKSVVDLAANWQYHWADQLWEDNQRPQAVALLKSALPASTLLPTLTSPLTPQDEARLSNNAAWRLAVVAEPSLRATKKSVELARRATELVPDNSNYVQSLGTALYFDGDYAAAREQLLKAIQLEQAASKRGTLDQLLEALKTLPKDPAAARKEFDASLGLQNSSPHAMSLYYSMLSMTLWKLDDQATARDTLRLVVDPPADFSTDGPETRRLIAEARALVRSE